MSKQRDEDFWEPAPALVKRLKAAIRSCKTPPFSDDFSLLFRAVKEDAEERTNSARAAGASELPDSERVGDKAFWGDLLVTIAEMEDYFLSILEIILPTGALAVESGTLLSEGDIKSLTKYEFMSATTGLMSTESCRRNIAAGKTAAAVWDMHGATDFYHTIQRDLIHATNEPHLVMSYIQEERHKRSTDLPASTGPGS